VRVFGLLYSLGWLGSTVLIVRLVAQGHSRGRVFLAVLAGLVVGLFWPVTLWIAVGTWWRRRAARPSRGSSPSAGLRPLVGTIGACAAGSIVTFGALGAVAPPPEPASLASSTVPAPAPSVPASTPVPVALPAPLTVAGVVDGDTVDLSDGRRVRLLGIDTPEQGECGHAEATAFARTTLLDRSVQVVPDRTQDAADRYGRALLHLYAPQDYSTTAAGAGWAESHVYDNRPVQRAPQIRAAQRAAQDQRLGIWGDLCAPPPASAPVTTEHPPPAARQDDDDRSVAAVPVPRPEPRPEPAPDPGPAAGSDCHPSYVPCVPDGPDLDCGEIGYSVRVVGPDEYRLDGENNDGEGCESY
jgi:endonuclease YncB( thermonuclease family)